MRLSVIIGTVALLIPAIGALAQNANELPNPLIRYLAFAVEDDRPIKAVEMRLSGQVILPGHTNAIPVKGQQIIGVDHPSMDWRVSAKVNWAIKARIRDHYEHGIGSIHSRINRLRTVIDDRDIPELNKTQLARWSGLAVMAPTALTSDHRYTFDAEGRLVESVSDDRWERYDGEYKRVRTIMRRSNWTRVDGVVIPLNFHLIRVEPDGSKTDFWVGEFSEVKIIR